MRCEPRRAAYAILFDAEGRVAVVRSGEHWFLPGGGAQDGESAQETVLREIREELGRQARLLGPLGEAVQYFRDSTRWYEMTATFFRAELVGAPIGSAEHEVVWLDATSREGFFHPCHVWALARARGEQAQER